jgi:hypothetical protein
MVNAEMKDHKDHFVCLLSALQRRQGEELVAGLMIHRVLFLVSQNTLQQMERGEGI